MDNPKGIRPSGRGLQIRVQHGGRTYYETIPGNLSASHFAQAVKRRKQMIAILELGGDLTAAAENPPFIEAAQHYLDMLEAKRSTHLSYENILNTRWIPAFGRMPLLSIDARTVRETVAQWDVSPKTKRNALGPLAGIFTLYGVTPNPAVGLRFQRRQRAPVQRYTPDEWKAIQRHLSGQSLVYFTLLIHTGLRPGEALGLLWTDYSGAELSITKQIVRRRLEPTTKTYERRTVYVPQQARSALNGHVTRFEGGHIFQNTKGGPHLDTDVFNEAWRKAHRRARIPYRIPYTLRHTKAAQLLSAGIQPADAAKYLGHSTEMFLRTYSEFIEEYSASQDRKRFELAI